LAILDKSGFGLMRGGVLPESVYFRQPGEPLAIQIPGEMAPGPFQAFFGKMFPMAGIGFAGHKEIVYFLGHQIISGGIDQKSA